MRRLSVWFVVLTLAVVLMSVSSAAAPKPAERVVLTINGDTAAKNYDAGFQMDMPMLESVGLKVCGVKDPWMGDKKYQGVLISDVLQWAGVSHAAESVTVTAKDGKKVVLKMCDVLKYPILLAFKDGEKPIGQGTGGPIKLVFPYDTHPEVEKIYNKDLWCWYVVKLEVSAVKPTVPKEKVAFTVSGEIALSNASSKLQFDMDGFTALGLSQCNVKDPWMGNKKYEGVLVRDILNYAGVSSLSHEVAVVAKDGKKVQLKLDDVYRYPIILAVKDGDKAIGNGMGGPIKLVFPYDTHPDVQKIYGKDNWSWYVTELEIK